MPGFPTAFPHVSGIKSQRDKSAAGQLVGVNTRSLFLDARVGRTDYQRGMRGCFVHILRRI